ncbi:MAG TPA: family 1 glycosylhydrolase [Sphingomicrobium sp.]|nr:family 1 glycosylhydrolase [Sphingomicrobium sp.]
MSGALAMEVGAYALRLAGLPSVDLAAELGRIVDPGGTAVGTALGLAAHASVGIAWALFYAYFFWSRFSWRPALQGLAFATIPAILAIFFVYPQLQLMQLHSEAVNVTPADFYSPLSVPALISIVLMHALYGLTIGAIYTHPVGYRTGHAPPYPPPPRDMTRSDGRHRRSRTSFMFATGIECSYPTIEHGRWRRDEMQSAGHYYRWQEDFDLCRKIGITHLRYGPPLHLVFQGPGKYDWSRCDDQLAELQRYGPEPIIDLCHFGLPAWLENFQNEEIVPALAEYAGTFAERYPWVRLYTPVNEMYICARMSALLGNWNEQKTDDASFVRACFNLAGASIAMTDAILKHCSEAIFINSESSDFTQPCCPDPKIVHAAQMENERRFLPLDLIYSHELSDTMKDYIRDNGGRDRDLAKFDHREVPRRSILGIDYYEWNERLIDSEGHVRSLGELFGWYVIASQYYDRYKRPMMHTETNKMDAADAPRWLWRQWHNIQLIRKSGVPLVGFTWYSLTDQVDWSIAMTKALGMVFPVGLFDLNRDVRTVGLAYKQLIDMFADQPEFRESKALQELVC